MTAREWLIADGLGGYAMGTADGIRTRRYHGLLLVASPATEQRFMLVNGVEAWLDADGASFALSSQRYVPDTIHPLGASAITGFSRDPWPTWHFATPAGSVEFSASGSHGRAATTLRWRFAGAGAVLRVRLQMSGRDWHALHRENQAFRFDADEPSPDVRRFVPYDGVPPLTVAANASYRMAPLWFRNCQYDEERARGLDHVEDLASPGEFTFNVGDGRDAVMVLSTDAEYGGAPAWRQDERPAAVVEATRDAEAARLGALSALERAADAFIVRRGQRRTVIAGYPWFTDWGRDTFISTPALCGLRRGDAQEILLSWCGHLADGMMPNLFPAAGREPVYNSVDASLWFVDAVRELAVAAGPVPQVPAQFIAATEEILTRYARGTRYGIHVDSDGLLAAGMPGVALTWMDAVVDGIPVTPRIGKPVEVQALWISALTFAGSWNKRWISAAHRARESFARRFWNAKRGCLYDVVDVDHEPGRVDDRLRPNQVLACGPLSAPLVSDERVTAITDVVEGELWTPVGLRTLARGDPEYVGRVDGPLRQRDMGYHQGTVWPWLIGPFATAWSRGHAGGWDEARRRFGPHAKALVEAGGGFVPEIFDGDAPHAARGCPFQAWSTARLWALAAS